MRKYDTSIKLRVCQLQDYSAFLPISCPRQQLVLCSNNRLPTFPSPAPMQRHLPHTLLISHAACLLANFSGNYELSSSLHNTRTYTHVIINFVTNTSHTHALEGT